MKYGAEGLKKTTRVELSNVSQEERKTVKLGKKDVIIVWMSVTFGRKEVFLYSGPTIYTTQGKFFQPLTLKNKIK